MKHLVAAGPIEPVGRREEPCPFAHRVENILIVKIASLGSNLCVIGFSFASMPVPQRCASVAEILMAGTGAASVGSR